MTESEADGFIRRFDDLGRIGIPKKLRRQLFGTPEKSEGMPMEVFMDKDEIIIRKYIEHISDDVCEWKDKELYGYYTSCTEFRSRIACKDTYWKYCPYCGKKIKVVE